MTDPIQEYIDEIDAQDEEGQQAPEAPAEAPEPEPVEEPEAEEAEAEAEEEELIAGRFKSTDDLAKSYLSLEEKFKERDDELGELRKFKDQYEWQREYEQQQPQQIPLNQETVDWFDEQAMENPQGAVQWAMQNDPSGVLYNRAMDQWYESNPRQASSFERQLEMSMLARAMDERYGSQLQPLTQNQTKQDFVSAWEQAAEQYPDLSQYAEQITEIAQESPEILQMLEKGTPESKQRVIQNLYFQAKGRQADTVAVASQDAAATEAAETAQVRKDASFVATGSKRPAESRSNVERWLEEVFDPAAAQYYGE